jgi:dienelactone hydrolase
MITAQKLQYQADGLEMSGWLAQDDRRTDQRPAVLVFPAAPGLGMQVREAAERLAALGYVALGCDLYGGGRFFDDVDEALMLLTPLRTRADGVRARAGAALAALVAQPVVDPARVAAIG